MILNMFFLICGILLLIKGSDFVVDSGSLIAKIFKISEILMGLTFVSFGTSLPELIIGINASFSNNPGIIIGNIVGTNIFNMCAILGIICIINPVKFLRETVKKDIYMSLLSAAILLIVVLDSFQTKLIQNVISRTDGMIFMLFFGIFMYYTLYSFNEYKQTCKEKSETVIHLKLKDIDAIVKNIFLMILGLAMIFIGADFVVDSATSIAQKLHLNDAFIAIVIIAIGTSLPEITTSITAIKKGKGNLAIGNLIGSNMFNTLFVLGVSSIISPIVLPMNSLIIDCIVYVIACLVIAIFSRMKFEISRKEGICLVLIYLGYLIYVLNRL